MTPLKQRNRHRPEEGIYGDCHRAALASVLDLALDEVPHFCDPTLYPENWSLHERAWLLKRGLVPLTMIFDAELQAVLDNMSLLNPDTYYILGGKSRSDCGHSVVCLNDKIVHDPSLNDSGIIGPMSDGFYWITLFGTAQAVAG